MRSQLYGAYVVLIGAESEHGTTYGPPTA